MATQHPATTPPAPAVMRVLGRFDRQALASFITVAIDLLDIVDGDPDEEANGDELDGSAAEDDFTTGDSGDSYLCGAGCPVSDPPKDDDPGGGNVIDDPHDEDDGL